MSLLEKDRIDQEKAHVENEKIYLEGQIVIGKSAERLLNNPDWKRIAFNIEKTLSLRKEEVQKSIQYSIIGNADTTADGDHKLCNELRKAFQEISDFEYILNLPKREMEVGEEASKALLKLREEKSNG